MAARFWVGGTGTWDASDTTHWSATTGGATGASVPGSSDTATFDASSGGGTVTVNTNFNISSLTMGAFTGTLDFSINNNSSATTLFSITGTGVRTLKLGSGTHTITSTSAAAIWTAAAVTNLTFDAGTSTIVIAGTTTNGRTFAGGGLTYNNVTINANTSKGVLALSGANTFANLTVTAPGNLTLPILTTQTVTGTLSLAGSSGSLIGLGVNSPGSTATISKASGSVVATYCGISDITVSGGAAFSATSSFDLGRNVGWSSITEPAGGGSTGSHMIGG